MTRRVSAAAALALSLFLATDATFFASKLNAGGLSTNLGEVVIQGLEVGERYSLKELSNVTLSVVNRGEDSVLVRVTPLVPDSAELRQNAEPIPSVEWIGLESDSLDLAPGEMKVSNIFIEIPPDTTLRGRKFQATLWSRTIPGPGVFIACGLKSRVIFSIAAGGALETEESSTDNESSSTTGQKANSGLKQLSENPERGR